MSALGARPASRFRALGAVALALALALLALVPALARAEARAFGNNDVIFPEGLGVFGPATTYPSTIQVTGIPGTVAKVTVTLLDVEGASPDDMDVGLRGPNGQTTMLVSDACGEVLVQDDAWTFDDTATTFLSDNGPCPTKQAGTFKPTNYVGASPEPDDLSFGFGPAAPYANTLAALAGGSPDGTWELFGLDDREGVIGLDVVGWVLTLDVAPPASAAPPAAAPIVAPARTGKRAAALAKCKTKKSKKAKSRCRAKARKLPL